MERRILIYPAVAQDGLLAGKVLSSVGLQTVVCTGSEAVLAALAEGAGALLVVEEVISGKAILPLKRFVDAQPAWSDLPILVLTKRGADSLEAQRAVEHLGNVSLLERPVRTIALISAAHSALRARERQYQVRLAEQRKDEFLATLAHELRNPLAPIRTSISIIRRLQPSGEVEKLADVVDRQVIHLTRLVDDLLDVARITTGKVALNSTHTTLGAVITHALEIASSSVQEKAHSLEVTQPQEDFALNADHARIVQSVANLLVNAAKYTPAHGHISLLAEVDGDVVTFRVRDDGRGLAADSLTRIFEMFAQTKSPNEPLSGLGIGLNLARKFAEMHGGEITAASEGLGKGSEFVLTLPVVVGVEPADHDAAPHGTEAGAGGRRVLVVDDNSDAADTLEALLTMEGFSVSVAYDGATAVEKVKAEEPDVVLMDIGMPRMDGYQAARLIRGAGKPVRLIALTGWGQALDKTKARDAGFDHHFVKPVDLPTIIGFLKT
ncbi:MAG: response regulator [Burkholderiales bacterium]|nr:response regulator [Burkholderiales bacterium]